jgi:hypothetical protein
VADLEPQGFKDCTAELRYDLSAFCSAFAGGILKAVDPLLSRFVMQKILGLDGRVTTCHAGNARCALRSCANVSTARLSVAVAGRVCIVDWDGGCGLSQVTTAGSITSGCVMEAGSAKT